MLSNRDFSKSNKEYFKKNRVAILIFSLFLLLGLVFGIVFGFNGNFEFKGYNEFNITLGQAESKTVSEWKDKAVDVVNKHGGNVYRALIEGEGDAAKLVIYYYNKSLTEAKQQQINEEIASATGINSADISEHNHVGATVHGRDYLYAAVAIVLLVTIATIFAIFRYDGACAMCLILCCLLGSLLYMSFSTILRLQVGLSYFAMLFIVNMLIVYCAMQIFEHIRETSWLQSKDYSSALKTALSDTRTRILFVNISLMAIGLIFAIVAPTSLKFVSLNILFMAVALLTVVWYVLPFCWSVLITRTNIKRFKTKSQKLEDTKGN